MSPEFIGLIPEELLSPEKKRDFLLWLLALPLDVMTKKYVLIDWCRYVGIALTEEMVDIVTGGRADETRG